MQFNYFPLLCAGIVEKTNYLKMASTVSGSTAFTTQVDPDTGTFQRRLGDVSTFFYDSEEGKILGKSFQQWSKFYGTNTYYTLTNYDSFPDSPVCLHLIKMLFFVEM